MASSLIYPSVSTPVGHWCPRNPTRADLIPNRFNQLLQDEATLWDKINQSGGLQAFCRGRQYKSDPWVEMPPQGRRINKTGAAQLFTAPFGTTPATPQGVDQPIFTYMAPQGWDGCIKSVVNYYDGGTGGPYVEGAQMIVWRISIDGRWVDGFGNMINRLGSLANPWENECGVFFLQSGQTLTYWFNYNPITFVAEPPALVGGFIGGGIFGWEWPR